MEERLKRIENQMKLSKNEKNDDKERRATVMSLKNERKET